jgi:hypothetical protein
LESTRTAYRPSRFKHAIALAFLPTGDGPMGTLPPLVGPHAIIATTLAANVRKNVKLVFLMPTIPHFKISTRWTASAMLEIKATRAESLANLELLDTSATSIDTEKI